MKVNIIRQIEEFSNAKRFWNKGDFSFFLFCLFNKLFVYAKKRKMNKNRKKKLSSYIQDASKGDDVGELEGLQPSSIL